MYADTFITAINYGQEDIASIMIITIIMEICQQEIKEVSKKSKAYQDEINIQRSVKMNHILQHYHLILLLLLPMEI
ncbi:unnamed protein product [Paramecium primaurelia]|uniref:Uncharacterized protein n=1 Tax=Paramecium primaurelia TaxID=5886 RepID=A0A8S1JLM9_PARPR|nr:unnamed protein product [Paramecium primaurelia]